MSYPKHTNAENWKPAKSVGEKCPICRGQRIEYANGLQVAYCKACKGTGEVQYAAKPPATPESAHACLNCKGTGYFLPVDRQRERCGMCSGTGKMPAHLIFYEEASEWTPEMDEAAQPTTPEPVKPESAEPCYRCGSNPCKCGESAPLDSKLDDILDNIGCNDCRCRGYKVAVG